MMDPVTFEVIRHRLWAINDDQATMAARLSGSPIVYDAYDFNAALLTADGRSLYTGVYIMHHGATLDTFVRNVLEEWAPADIRPGDMFFTNDPWWGALHANDGILAMPVFWKDALVAWAGIVMHDNDVGSAIPGSWVTGAKDRFAEAPLLPAVKIAENFKVRRDIERLYLRNSRTAELNALNMRARVAALCSTQERIHDLIDQYGLDAFVDAQEGILRHVEDVLRRRLRELPDGSWYAQGYLDHDGSTDEIYRLCCRVTKIDDRLVFDTTGTSPQAPGPINCAAPALRAAICGVILSLLCYDVPWSIGGVDRVIEIRSEPGTLNNAGETAPTSMASIAATLSTQDVVLGAVSKMLLTCETQRMDAQATWSPGNSTGSYAAVNPDGEYSVTPIGNSFGGGGGARTFTDGIDTGGVFHSMASRIPNVETVESRSPLLQLYRRQQRDGAGPGRFRGGAGVEFAAVPHKTQAGAVANLLASGVGMPIGQGISGGFSGAAVSNIVLRDTDVREQFRNGSLPQAQDELRAGSTEVLAAKQLTSLSEADVLFSSVSSGAGYGDPLRRDPALVADDLRRGLVSETVARNIYGVVHHDGHVDDQATREAREQILRSRLAAGQAPASHRPHDTSTEEPELIHPVLDTVDAVRTGDEKWLRCAVCRHRLGDYTADIKTTTLRYDLSLAEMSPANVHCRTDFKLRQYCCPSCGTAIASEVHGDGALPPEGDRLLDGVAQADGSG